MGPERCPKVALKRLPEAREGVDERGHLKLRGVPCVFIFLYATKPPTILAAVSCA